MTCHFHNDFLFQTINKGDGGPNKYIVENKTLFDNLNKSISNIFPDLLEPLDFILSCVEKNHSIYDGIQCLISMIENKELHTTYNKDFLK